MIRWQELQASASLAADQAVTEADWRRATSGLYYALFHRLCTEASAAFAASGPELEALVRRAFAHTAMRKVCDLYWRASRAGRFEQASLAAQAPPSPALAEVAASFGALQDARVLADYDLGAGFARAEMSGAQERATAAHQRLDTLLGTRELSVFLAALLLHDRWTRRG